MLFRSLLVFPLNSSVAHPSLQSMCCEPQLVEFSLPVYHKVFWSQVCDQKVLFLVIVFCNETGLTKMGNCTYFVGGTVDVVE